MKKITKVFASLVLALALLSSLSVAALAQESAVNHNSKDSTTVTPGSTYTKTDLFGDAFKGMMPGDTVSQEITVRNKADYCDYIRVYLRAVPHDQQNPLSPQVAQHEDLASMNDFLSQLSLKVYKDDQVIYQGSPDQARGLTENVLLGDIPAKHQAKLRVELTVPLELDNRYANRVGEVDWVFTIEGRDHAKPPAPSDPVVPVKPGDVLIQTGQLNWPIPVLVVAGGLLILLGAALLHKNKKQGGHA